MIIQGLGGITTLAAILQQLCMLMIWQGSCSQVSKLQVAVQLEALLRQDCRGQAASWQQLASKWVVMGGICLQQLCQ